MGRYDKKFQEIAISAERLIRITFFLYNLSFFILSMNWIMLDFFFNYLYFLICGLAARAS